VEVSEHEEKRRENKKPIKERGFHAILPSLQLIKEKTLQINKAFGTV